MPTALITGISGQDGAYLAKLLLTKGYIVKGLTRSYATSSVQNLSYLGIEQSVEIIECDLLDLSQIIKVLSIYKPDEIYNLAAQSSVSLSFQQPIGTIQFNTLSVLYLLEAIKLVNKTIRYYQASSSEMFGKVEDLPITESHTLYPLSPYAISKASAHWIAINYRESFGLYTSCGILFNHESYLRNTNFFVKKVIRSAIQIKNRKQQNLKVGNIDIKRDFGYAPLYVEAMWLMLQHSAPDDFLICSGKSISLKSIIEYVFNKLGISLDKLIIDPALYRPTDIKDIYGNPHKAQKVLGWEYLHNFYEILDWLIEEELQNYR